MSYYHILDALPMVYPNGEEGIPLKGMDTLEYSLSYFFRSFTSILNHFHTYSWQVKTAALLLMVCTILILFMFAKLLFWIKETRRMNKLEECVYNTFGPFFRQLLSRNSGDSGRRRHQA